MQNRNEKQQQSWGSITIWLLDSFLAFSPTVLSCPPGPGHSGLLPSSQTWHTYAWPQTKCACAAFLCHLHLADTHQRNFQSPWCYFLRILLHPSQGHFLRVPTTCWTSSSTSQITRAIICSRSCSLQDYKCLDRDHVHQVHYKIFWYMVAMQEVFAELTLRRR